MMIKLFVRKNGNYAANIAPIPNFINFYIKLRPSKFQNILIKHEIGMKIICFHEMINAWIYKNIPNIYNAYVTKYNFSQW
ncbi:hypothetical protein Anas_12923 [Armadillidium nasatum]|uniref:Uncharacterized protein n=1 Tax=Armadillidium nasatum TaxID=96803 RepID=A0A5N5T5H8_9CRUS|nr:hypothetical protein Anas_12923 [Armadillidium nasatum]